MSASSFVVLDRSKLRLSLIARLYGSAPYGCLGRGRGRSPIAPPVANPVAPSALQRVSGGTPQTRFRFLRPTHRPSGPRQPGPPRAPQLRSLMGAAISGPRGAVAGGVAKVGPAVKSRQAASATRRMVGSPAEDGRSCESSQRTGPISARPKTRSSETPSSLFIAADVLDHRRAAVLGWADDDALVALNERLARLVVDLDGDQRHDDL